MRIDKRISNTTEYIKVKLKNRNLTNFLLNLVITLLSLFYIMLRYKFINPEIPFWYTKLWGDYQLASKSTIYLLPIVAVGINLVGLLLVLLNKFYIRFFEGLIWSCVFFCNIFLSASAVRIIQIASVPFEPIINPLYANLIPAFIFAFLLILIVTPYFIDLAKREKLVTNPQVHSHPGMLLQNPSARGGGFVYTFVFLVSALLFVGLSKELMGLYLSILMVAVLGIIDDYQNTHSSSAYRMMENPVLRLFLLFTCVLPVVFSGLMIYTISDPLGGVINLNVYELGSGVNALPLIPMVFTILWVVWLMNVLSWSNGVDGQFPGIVGIASILIALLALRFEPLSQFHTQIAMLSAISAGAAFGFVKFNWHPSKIMWGFGAMSAGLVIASLAILAQAKIAVSVLILLVPFLDALFTVSRRLLNGKNPLKGDRGHLHHLLLDRGWSVSKVALFYWFATALFGLIGLLSPERIVLQVSFVVIGVVAFILIILNVSLNSRKDDTLPTV